MGLCYNIEKGAVLAADSYIKENGEENKMKFTYQPKGVCSKMMEIEVENDVVRSLKVLGAAPATAGHFSAGDRHEGGGGHLPPERAFTAA